MNRKIKQIRLELMKGQITLHPHIIKRMIQRGYSKSDIAICIMNGRILEKQSVRNNTRYVVSGKDTYGNPIIIVIQDSNSHFEVITAMPPIDHNRFDDCV